MSFVVSLDNAQCRALVEVSELKKLTNRFNRRKPRKGKTPVLLADMVFSGRVRIFLSRQSYYHSGGVEEMQNAIKEMEAGELADLVSVSGQCDLTHDMVDLVLPSCMNASFSAASGAALLRDNAEKAMEMSVHQLSNVRQQLGTRQRHLELQKAQEAQRLSQMEREKLDRLSRVRSLGKAGASALHGVVMCVRNLEGISAEARSALEAQLGLVVDESERWVSALEEAKRQLQNDRGPFGGFVVR